MSKRVKDPRTGQQAFLYADDETPKKCNQCWKTKELHHFINPRTARLTQDCNDCRAKYARGVENHRVGLRTEGELRVRFMAKSGNRKTGPIPVSITTSETCPPTCGFFNAGCYGESSLMRHHWRGAPEVGVSWSRFCSQVAKLPEGTLWRHNEVGDLPGLGVALDHEKLAELTLANVGRKGFTYTHKPLAGSALALVLWANKLGFTINASADTIAQADRFAREGLPTTVVLPAGTGPEPFLTPKGRTVVVCPAVHREGITCQSCQLCQVATRKSIVGFPAHGTRKNLVTQIVRGRRRTL